MFGEANLGLQIALRDFSYTEMLIHPMEPTRNFTSYHVRGHFLALLLPIEITTSVCVWSRQTGLPKM